MPLFVIQHQHPANQCPAQDPRMAPMLLQHLSQANAAKYGVRIQSHAVIDGAHTLYVIAEAANRDQVTEFMGPFAQAGSVEIQAASPCEAVVGRGAC